MRLVGLDGCKRGAWVAAEAGEGCCSVRFATHEDVREIFEAAARRELLAVIDIPIGLSDEPRACDIEARQAVGPRRSSVFRPPCRNALTASTSSEASSLNREACGKGLTIFSFGILRRIKQIDDLILPALQGAFREAHPEVTFAVLTGAHLHQSKKTKEGRQMRLGILAKHGIQFDLDAERMRLGRSRVARDDLIDAAACLLSARRIVTGRAVVLPAHKAERDARGLRMEIVA